MVTLVAVALALAVVAAVLEFNATAVARGLRPLHGLRAALLVRPMLALAPGLVITWRWAAGAGGACAGRGGGGGGI